MFQRGAVLFSLIVTMLTLVRSSFDLGTADPVTTAACLEGNSEALLACNRPLRYRIADQADLELIPGMTAKMSARLSEGRDKVMQKAMTWNPKRPYEPFEVLEGIGPKRAGKFG